MSNRLSTKNKYVSLDHKSAKIHLEHRPLTTQKAIAQELKQFEYLPEEDFMLIEIISKKQAFLNTYGRKAHAKTKNKIKAEIQDAVAKLIGKDYSCELMADNSYYVTPPAHLVQDSEMTFTVRVWPTH